MKKTVVAILACLAAISIVRADIIPSFTGTTPSGSNTVWNYQIDITTNQQVTTGDFFTIYDFGPFIAGSNTQPTGWTFSSSLVTAPPFGTNPPDNPTLENLTWIYAGSSVIPSGTTLGTFSVTLATTQFLEAPQTRAAYFAAQATSDSGPDVGTKINNVGQVPVPTAIPEPSTLSLIALAAVGAAGRAVRWRRR